MRKQGIFDIRKTLLLCILAIIWFTASARAEFCMPDRNSISIVAGDSSISRDALGARRLEFMMQEAQKIFRGSLKSDCKIEIRLVSPQPKDRRSFGKDAFRVIKQLKDYQIEATDSLGYLYGFYEVLLDLGVLFVSSGETVIAPSSAQYFDADFNRIVSPKVASRGLWAFGKDLDSSFLLWAGRNRFNLVGGEFKGHKEWFDIFGVKSWSGGHNVLSTLAPSDLVENGKTLIEAHPDWFGVTNVLGISSPENPIPNNSESYTNPCFGNLEYTEFIGTSLIRALTKGVYKRVDMLNIWPSDSPSLRMGKHCELAPGSENATDDLIVFYNRLVQILAESPEMQKMGRSVEIAGIGYYGSYDLSKTKQKFSKSSNNSSYVHVFYNNVRSYQGQLEDIRFGVNQRLLTMLDNTIDRHKLTKFGIVDYFNYSIYRSMVSPNINLLKGDINSLSERGMSLYAYMHPSSDPSIFQSTLDFALSRFLFNSENPKIALERFSAYVLGDSNLKWIIEDYESAIKNIFEIFGPETSLWLIQMADRFWASPPLDMSQILKLSEALQNGHDIFLTPMRLGSWGGANFHGQGLNETLSRLRSLEEKITALQLRTTESKPPKNTSRLATVATEVQRTRLLFELAEFVTLHRIASEAKNLPVCQQMLDRYQANIATLSSMPWPKKVSKFGGRKQSLSALTKVFDDFLKPACSG
ncbi:MAG: hypothetical protein JKX93_12730 [Rhizobiaceae bacterium]|nr:hypothetical protein [Rhizobiaceae bacterium]